MARVIGYSVKVEGMDKLQKQFDSLGRNFPKGQIRKAAKKGSKLPLKKAIADAPKGLTGQLKQGIIQFEERVPRRKKKVVYRVVFDRAKNDIFRKPISEEGRGTRGGQTEIPWAYYPVSVEYGFAVSLSKRKPGRYFVRDAIEETQHQSLKTIVKSLSDSIDKLLKKRV